MLSGIRNTIASVLGRAPGKQDPPTAPEEPQAQDPHRGGVRPQPPAPAPSIGRQSSDPEEGGEIVTSSGAHMAFADDGSNPGSAGLTEDPDAGGEIVTSSGVRMAFADDGGASPASAPRTEVRDAHDRFGVTEDPDAGGEIARKAGRPQPDLRADPDDGGEVDGGFGTGATPPRPVTMTADDLRADPDDGGELTGDLDFGGEASQPAVDSLGIGIDDLALAEDPDAGGEVTWDDPADDPLAASADAASVHTEPVVATDLVLSADLDEAEPTFDGE